MVVSDPLSVTEDLQFDLAIVEGDILVSVSLLSLLSVLLLHFFFRLMNQIDTTFWYTQPEANDCKIIQARLLNRITFELALPVVHGVGPSDG